MRRGSGDARSRGRRRRCVDGAEALSESEESEEEEDEPEEDEPESAAEAGEWVRRVRLGEGRGTCGALASD